MPDPFLHPPLPRHDGPHQSGIADPIWPPEPAASIDPAQYKEHYAGQIERQNHLHAVFADVTVASRQELIEVLKALSGFARHQMDKTPPPLRPLDPPPVNRRVSVTVGLGATLFTTIHGDDRFTLAGARPKSLKVMPAFAGDEGFMPAQQATDLVVLIASDDYYVNEYIFSRIYYGTVHPGIVARRVERGYSRPDSREPSGFEDGITNPKNLSGGNLLDQFVFVREGDPEPEWCVDGSYLAYRKIRRRMRGFFKMAMPEREAVFGVDRVSGLRHADPPPNAHGPKMNPEAQDAGFHGRHGRSAPFPAPALLLRRRRRRRGPGGSWRPPYQLRARSRRAVRMAGAAVADQPRLSQERHGHGRAVCARRRGHHRRRLLFHATGAAIRRRLHRLGDVPLATG